MQNTTNDGNDQDKRQIVNKQEENVTTDEKNSGSNKSLENNLSDKNNDSGSQQEQKLENEDEDNNILNKSIAEIQSIINNINFFPQNKGECVNNSDVRSMSYKNDKSEDSRSSGASGNSKTSSNSDRSQKVNKNMFAAPSTN